ncbi:conserved protein of unknown function [Nitrospira japonica]|uniref:Uncharacterized protein n=1 Tax=Nitrospira japonica TaxID=1325564 RepID=A0A1W1I2L6_9BACT|nr:hypothetical protein [Nitrospira japonica]SLM47237.1 conserved protein of unknown function [Nitrospira japonica]
MGMDPVVTQVNEAIVGISFALDPSLEGLLARLDSLSRQPNFAVQRRLALELFLRPYLEPTSPFLQPLAQEEALALLMLYADFYPEDGQLTLVEQLRDIVTEHIPEEERRWLDPLKHSSMDLLEVLPESSAQMPLSLRSLGDDRRMKVQGDLSGRTLRPGDILLTRVIEEQGTSDRNVHLAGGALLLPMKQARSLLEASREWERSVEIVSGSFTLGEWQEFVKRYGYVLLWNAASLRLTALLEAVARIRYRTPSGTSYLYALALYDHHAYRAIAEGLSAMTELHEDARGPWLHGSDHLPSPAPVRIWVQRENEQECEGLAVRLTLTPLQLFVECDSPDRLNSVKHRLASAFGYSMRFRGESLTTPERRIPPDQLAKESPCSIVVTDEEQLALLSRFLDMAYLEWADQPSAALGGQTPRHAAAQPTLRRRVADLIDGFERHDPGMRLLGITAFNYGILRNHVGL